MEKYIRIGQIVNTHGNKGELKVYPLTDDPDRYRELKRVFVAQENCYREYTVRRARNHKGIVIMELDEIQDMNEAVRLKGAYLELPVAELRALPPGHYYIFQIVGLEVIENGVVLGHVTDIFKTGSNDVYQVEDAQGKKFYLPALKEVVRNIDLEAGKMEVVLPPGLLD